jgi:enamine deaminase RidA (YjgF/YER057c/UK114 family)
MGRIDERLAELGLTLPEPFLMPNANRTGCVTVGSIAFLSGHTRHGLEGHRGKVGADLTVEEGAAAARGVALSMLATLKLHLGDLDRVVRVIRLLGMVNTAPGFSDTPAVIDGASDLFLALFGPEHGRHARSAVGMAELPHDVPVEIEGEFEIVPS